MRTEKRTIQQAQDRADLATRLTEEYAFALGMSKKAKLQLCLLVEEGVGMLWAMSEVVDGSVWIEGDERETRICLEATARLDRDRRKTLLAMASNGKSTAGRGLMATLGAFIVDSLYHMGQSVQWLANETFKNGMVGPNGVAAPMSDANMIPVWSLEEYRQNLRASGDADDQAALFDLERSIVARLADDLIVSLQGKKVNLVIVKR